MPSSETERPLVFVTVGTDDHPFDRLIEWVDRWRRTDRGQEADLVIQYGMSRPPREGEAHALMPYPEVRATMARAAVVVTHGGAGRILVAQEAGVVPLVVARTGDGIEASDDRQEVLVRRLSAGGLCDVIGSQDELHRALNDVVTGRRTRRAARNGSLGDEASTRFGHLVDDLFAEATG